VDFKRNPLLLLCIGLLAGIVIAEAVYYVFSPVVLADGSVVVVTDRDYYGKASELLSGAKESIHIVMFSANYKPKYDDSHVNELLRAIIAAHNRGVDVKIVMDSFPEGNDKTLNYLLKNNIPARILNIPGATTHSKLIIVDGVVVMVGSTNWSYHSIDKNHEANVVISDARIASEFEDYFRGVYSAA
jgi:phosphatidylserine/phosphatidylglycerophosphate/cardiolipin synthase-like enzyme